MQLYTYMYMCLLYIHVNQLSSADPIDTELITNVAAANNNTQISATIAGNWQTPTNIGNVVGGASYLIENSRTARIRTRPFQ